MRGFGVSTVFYLLLLRFVSSDSGNKRFLCQPEGEEKEGGVLSDEIVNTISSLIDTKLEELESKLEERIWRRMMDVSLGESGTNEPPKEAVEVSKQCDFEYEDKCFAFFHAELMTFVEGKQRCKDAGGHMANIYSKAHEDIVLKYIQGIDLGPVFFFIGMKLDTKTMKVSLQDGSPASYVNWYTEGGYPQTEHSLIRYTVLPSFHGMFNNVDALAAKSNGVFCEI